MTRNRILIVEDDALIAMDVEDALRKAGYEVCGVAASETEALAIARETRPELAVVDVNLNPGDGRVVARALNRFYGAVVLLATGQCSDVSALRGSGAVACLPKPYAAHLLPAALEAACQLADGVGPGQLPDHMISLAAA